MDPAKKAVGVDFSLIEPQAISECEAAARGHPQEARFFFQLGRALEKAERFGEARDKYYHAARLGYPIGYNNIAIQYKSGTGVARSLLKAIEYHRKAWDEGFYTAASNLASIYREGGQDVSPDRQQALEWLNLGAKAAIHILRDNWRTCTKKVMVLSLTRKRRFFIAQLKHNYSKKWAMTVPPNGARVGLARFQETCPQRTC